MTIISRLSLRGERLHVGPSPDLNAAIKLPAEDVVTKYYFKWALFSLTIPSGKIRHEAICYQVEAAYLDRLIYLRLGYHK